ncbi:MAG TPA: hypothetical protein VLB69_00430 [Rudaea sp.]|nr:hypothetical protein [Rudaea sp.]
MTAWLEQVWTVRYLDRQLTSEEATWFEAYALDKPDLLAMIEADTRLRDALAADASMRHKERSVDGERRQGGATGDMLPGGGEPTPIAPAQDDPAAHASRYRPVPAWLAMAATLVLGLGLGWVGARSSAPRNAVPRLVASPTRIIYDTMRGEPTPPRVEHADSNSPYLLVELAVPPGAENITLKMGDAPEQKLTPSPDGFVSFLVGRDEAVRGSKASVRYSRSGNATTQTLDLSPPTVPVR